MDEREINAVLKHLPVLASEIDFEAVFKGLVRRGLYEDDGIKEFQVRLFQVMLL